MSVLLGPKTPGAIPAVEDVFLMEVNNENARVAILAHFKYPPGVETIRSPPLRQAL